MTADDSANCSTVGAHRAPLQGRTIPDARPPIAGGYSFAHINNPQSAIATAVSVLRFAIQQLLLPDPRSDGRPRQWTSFGLHCKALPLCATRLSGSQKPTDIVVASPA